MSSLLILISSCSVSKYLPEGERYYNETKLELSTDSLSKNEKKDFKSSFKPLLRPIPNKKILGWRYKVWFFHKAGTPKKEKGLRHWVKTKLGEEPVYISEVNTERNANLIRNYLENNGFFKAKAAGDTILKQYEGDAVYDITVGPRYRIKEVFYLEDQGGPEALVKETSDKSLLKPGDPYNFETIKTERERIDGILKENGYYLFSPDYLLMRIDSSIGENQINIFVKLKRETPSAAIKKWYIKNIYIYSDYSASQDSLKIDSSYWHDNYYIIDPDSTYKKKVFDRTIFFTPNEAYNRADHNKTLNRLVNIGTFRFVRNRFEELSVLNDSGWLNSYYYLVNAKRKSMRVETTGKTTSANFNGVEFSLNLGNKNTFRAAEQLFLKFYGGVDVQFASQNQGYNILRVGAEGGITWPRFVGFKFRPNTPFVPHTKLTAGYEWQQRQRLYTLTTIKSSFGYQWKKNVHTEQDFNPLNFTYVNSRDVSDEYRQQIARDSNLARIIEEQLIIGPSYTHIYTNTTNSSRKHTIYYKGGLELSGNVLGLLQGANAKEGDVKTLLDVPYSQFIKTEHDFRYYRKLSQRQQDLVWVNRLNIGVGVPYGNSLQLPFIKQFFTGGSNNMRAFRVRSVGPGSYRPEAPPGSFLPDLVGDIKLEMNSEIRTKLFSIVHGALFVDAGNIWLFNNNPLKPGAQFSSTFLKELAVGTGAGIRLDIAGIFMLRLDLGIPLRKPWLEDGQRWVFNDIVPANAQWRRENLVFNLAVGMPF